MIGICGILSMYGLVIRLNTLKACCSLLHIDSHDVCIGVESERLGVSVIGICGILSMYGLVIRLNT